MREVCVYSVQVWRYTVIDAERWYENFDVFQCNTWSVQLSKLQFYLPGDVPEGDPSYYCAVIPFNESGPTQYELVLYDFTTCTGVGKFLQCNVASTDLPCVQLQYRFTSLCCITIQWNTKRLTYNWWYVYVLHINENGVHFQLLGMNSRQTKITSITPGSGPAKRRGKWRQGVARLN